MSVILRKRQLYYLFMFVVNNHGFRCLLVHVHSHYQRVCVVYVQVKAPIETMGQNTSSAERPGTDALVLTPTMSPKS